MALELLLGLMSNSCRRVRAGHRGGPIRPWVGGSATYSCTIAAASDCIQLGTSTVVILDPIPAGELPATGTDALSTAWTAVAAAAGILLLVAVHKPRRTRPRHRPA